MFKKQKKSRIINSFNNIYHLEKESNINVGISYFLLFIPLVILFFSTFLGIFNMDTGFPYSFITVVTAFINLYRISWTYKDSFRCLLTFLGTVICFFIFTVFFNRSPLSNIPAQGLIDLLISTYQKNPSAFSLVDGTRQFLYLLSYNYNIQTFFTGQIQNVFSLTYAHAIYVFIIHYQVRETQTMMNFYNLGIEPKLIADYILDPDNNKKIEEEALYRYSLNLDKINRDQDRPKITMSESIYFEKDDELDGNNKVFKKNNLVNPTTPEPAWDEDKLSPQDNKDYLEDNNLDNKKKRFFNSTSSYFDSLRSEDEFDQNLEEDDSDEKKKD